ncbi:tRNA (adenosine(37)-N6)-threonylcarbamoyltransferase complex ATPase subunit type 1 TsaE, partial [Candidatus Kaiserbacteria bacterium]|nr:tRNA (adenosine(37)-N6)-threonylcarbamoyltransferase complex ATPase subunit type 1 TsaE [Candidatus Kaiserbacteria bacterium]
SKESDLKPVVSAVLAKLAKVERQDGCAVLALHGDLGAGKTTFMQYLAKALGIKEVVISPTFVVMKHYEITDSKAGSWQDLYHLDAYRIEEIDEMRPLGFADLLTKPNTLVAIEWAEKIEELLPSWTLHLRFAISGEERTITMEE